MFAPMIPAFSIARLPRIAFGAGVIRTLPALLATYSGPVLLVTGKKSFTDSAHWSAVQPVCDHVVRIDGEPSPHTIDAAVRAFHPANIGVVVGIGGGSVLDAAKAIAGLLRSGDSVMDYLEGVGPEKSYMGPAVPCIAVPTTAGTGSEATKNAVLSVQGENGFKKSFRDDQLVPEYAVIDPDLLIGCPLPQIAANAMDALTQLIEAYVSMKSNPLTDALAESGIQHVRDSLFAWYDHTDQSAAGRAGMAYAALLSGICLAQAGLGSVHGLASPLGAFFPIPHGIVCGTLMGAATRVNITALQNRDPESSALHKYARVAELLSRCHFPSQGAAHTALITFLDDWTIRLDLPRLRTYGIQSSDIARIVAHSRGSSMKTNPVALQDAEIAQILEQRM